MIATYITRKGASYFCSERLAHDAAARSKTEILLRITSGFFVDGFYWWIEKLTPEFGWIAVEACDDMDEAYSSAKERILQEMAD